MVQIDEARFNFHTVEGRNDAETIDSVRTFTGQAFRVERDVEPLLTLPAGSTLMGMNQPDAAQSPQFLLNVTHWLSGLID